MESEKPDLPFHRTQFQQNYLMPTPHSSFSTQQTSVERVSGAVYRGVEAELRRKCARRYRVDISLSRPENNQDEEGAAGEVRVDIRLEPSSLRGLRTCLWVTHLGGNVYEVLCSTDEGRSRRWTLTLPNRNDTAETQVSDWSLDACTPISEVAGFLMEGLEKRLGRLLLQSSEATAKVGETATREVKQ